MGRTYGQKLAPGQILARQGERLETVFKLRSGRIQARVLPEKLNGPIAEELIRHDSRLILISDKAGTLLGEGGALIERRAASLVAETEAEVDVIPVSTRGLGRAIDRHPEHGMALAGELARQIVEIGHGISLLDGYLRRARDEADEQFKSFRLLVDSLRSQVGAVRDVAESARKSASYRRGPSAPAGASIARASSEARELQQGQALFLEGEPAPEFYLVSRGSIGLGGSGWSLADAGEGQLVGIEGVIGGGRHPFDARAVRPSQVAAIPASKLTDIAAEHLVSALSGRLDGAYRRMAEVVDSADQALLDLEGGLAADIERLGRGLAPWTSDLGEPIRELRERLAGVRTAAHELRTRLDSREAGLGKGLSYCDMRAEYEYRTALAGMEALLDRLRTGRGRIAPKDLALTVDSLSSYAGLGADLHFAPSATGARRTLAEHCVSVAVWSARVAVKLQLEPRLRREVVLAALLHDVGMLRADRPDFQMERHPTEYATALLSRIPSVPPGVFPPICEHHEFVDGSGYPRRLAGHRLSVGGLIISAANQLDLVIAKGLGPLAALDHLKKTSARFDPEILSALIELVRGG